MKSPADEIYFVAGTKPWNRRIFDDVIVNFPGQWHYIQKAEELSLEKIQALSPKYIFFLHWSAKVPQEIIQSCQCIVFHMTDVPYGRGGSPLQNLIARGHRTTKLSAIRMVQEFDAGPVYLKEELSLEGNAEEIYIRATRLAATMIQRILMEQPLPVPQSGQPTIFKRRKPKESEIQNIKNIDEFYDFIRMLDAEGYPKAFLVFNGFRLEFSRASIYNDRLVADVAISHFDGVDP